MINLKTTKEYDPNQDYSIQDYFVIQGFCNNDNKKFCIILTDDEKFFIIIDEVEAHLLVEECFDKTFNNFLDKRYGKNNYVITDASLMYPDINCEIVFN